MKTIYTYTTEEAMEDGVLTPNPKQECFEECNIITSSLYEELKVVSMKRSMKQVFGESVIDTIGHLMSYARMIYDNEKFEGDNDKNFFVVEKGWEMEQDVWFVRNGEGKLTAMLPSDY